MVTVYLSLGSNIEPREKNLKKAEEEINAHAHMRIIKSSCIYETEPWGVSETMWFLNACLKIKTSLNPYAFLYELQHIEKKLGRTQKGVYAPRTIDIDILLYGNKIMDTEELTIPHKHMRERLFVLTPLLEIAPHLKDPISKIPLKKFHEYLVRTET